MITMRTTLTTAAAALLVLGSGAPLTAQSAPVPSPSPTTLALPITFTGEVRSRTEWDAPGGAAAADLFSMLRTRFGARVQPTSGRSLGLRLQDRRLLRTQPN